MTTSEQKVRVLILRAGQLGDTIFASCAIESLRELYGPSVEIDLIVKSGMEALFADDPRINRIFGIDHRNLPLLLNHDKLRIVRASHRQPYDVLLNFELGDQFPLLARLIRAGKKFGRPYHFVADDRQADHAVEHFRRILGLAMPPEKAARANPSLVGRDFPPVKKRLGLTDDYIVLNPTNSHFNKQDYRSYRAWPVGHWRQLIDLLVAERPEKVVLIGNRGEQDYFKLLAPLPPEVMSIVGETSITELISVLQHAKALITTDTGPSHLAAAVNTPVLAIFGPSDYRKTGPFPTPDNTVRIVSAGLDCSPCSLTDRIKECPLNRCMHDLAATEILHNLNTLLN